MSAIAIGLVDPSNPKRYTIWVGSYSTGTVIRHSGVTSFTYAGNQIYRPILEISSYGSSPAKVMQFRNAITGATLDLDYDLQPGEAITVDLEAGTVTSSLFGNVQQAILPASEWADFYVVPGENIITGWVETQSIYAFMQIKEVYDGVD